VFSLQERQAQAIAQKAFHQHDHLAAIVSPHAGFRQGQGDMVVVAAFAATYAGKRRVHCSIDRR